MNERTGDRRRVLNPGSYRVRRRGEHGNFNVDIQHNGVIISTADTDALPDGIYIVWNSHDEDVGLFEVNHGVIGVAYAKSRRLKLLLFLADAIPWNLLHRLSKLLRRRRRSSSVPLTYKEKVESMLDSLVNTPEDPMAQLLAHGLEREIRMLKLLLEEDIDFTIDGFSSREEIIKLTERVRAVQAKFGIDRPDEI